MVKFWQVVSVLGGVLFIVILYGMVQKSEETRANVIANTEERLYSDAGTATFITNHGQFTLELELEKAPRTVANFVKLAGEGFYNGQRFHRVIDGFMIQGGDPLSKEESKRAMWGTGGPGYMFADEFGEGLSNVVGTISMANAGPNTNGSQFFINVADNTFLNGKHAVFGKVTSGMDVVLKISGVETGPSDQPVSDVIIERIEVK
jgi:cyclophilin family peptidyl-prolyl cis-trans isomerase